MKYGKVHLALWYSLGPGEMFPPSVGCTFENSWDASCFVPFASWCKISLDEISRWSFEQMNCQNASCFLHLALWCRISLVEILRLNIFEQLKCQDESCFFHFALWCKIIFCNFDISNFTFQGKLCFWNKTHIFSPTAGLNTNFKKYSKILTIITLHGKETFVFDAKTLKCFACGGP